MAQDPAVSNAATGPTGREPGHNQSGPDSGRTTVTGWRITTWSAVVVAATAALVLLARQLLPRSPVSEYLSYLPSILGIAALIALDRSLSRGRLRSAFESLTVAGALIACASFAYLALRGANLVFTFFAAPSLLAGLAYVLVTRTVLLLPHALQERNERWIMRVDVALLALALGAWVLALLVLPAASDPSRLPTAVAAAVVMVCTMVALGSVILVLVSGSSKFWRKYLLWLLAWLGGSLLQGFLNALSTLRVAAPAFAGPLASGVVGTGTSLILVWWALSLRDHARAGRLKEGRTAVFGVQQLWFSTGLAFLALLAVYGAGVLLSASGSPYWQKQLIDLLFLAGVVLFVLRTAALLQRMRRSESEAQLGQIFEAGQAKYVFGEDVRVVAANRRFIALTGTDPRSRSLDEVLAGPALEHTRAEAKEAIADVRETSREKTLDAVFMPAIGRYYRVTYSPAQWSGVRAVLVSYEDITERKLAEDALARRTEELARSNAELQHFAYVASHDLQEPLRMVASYTQLLERRYKGKLDSDADEFIAFAVDGATRMQALINGLLVYARAETQGKEPTPVDCGKTLANALDNLQMAIEESRAEITHDPMPTVLADDIQLGQLFQNLIANGIKFRGETPPKIHVGAKEDGEFWQFSIRDNGIGIARENFARIFQLFQRIHSLGKYPGTGIGLAVCKKIVERHGGRIWLESEPGKGATFNFTIPAKEVGTQPSAASR